jgi:hypothetical protein
MTPRLRVLFVTPEVHLLVIDRLGDLARAQVEALVAGTKSPATQGTLIFPFEVDIPDDPDGIEVRHDERIALREAVAVLRQDHSVAEDVTATADTLDLLLTRIEERL